MFDGVATGRRTLSRWRDATTGFFVVDAVGKVTVLVSEKAGPSANDPVLDKWVAVSDDGELAAAVKNKTDVLLMRLDGSNWPSSAPPSPTLSFGVSDPIVAATLHVGTTHVFFATTKSELMFIPRDGSAPPKKLALPKINGSPTQLAQGLAVRSRGGSTLATVLKAGTSARVGLFREGDAVVRAVSTVAPCYHAAGSSYVRSNLTPKLAPNPTGSWVAHVLCGSGDELGLSKADGSATLSLASSFSKTVVEYGALFWSDDDNLFFWAGEKTAGFGLYHYRVSNKVLSHVMGSKQTQAPWGGGTLRPWAVWSVGNGRRLFVASSPTSLHAIDLPSLKRQGPFLTSGFSWTIRAHGTTRNWVLSGAGTSVAYALSTFDELAPTLAVKKVAGPYSNPILGAHISADGAMAGYRGYMPGTQTGGPCVAFSDGRAERCPLMPTHFLGLDPVFAPDGRSVIVGGRKQFGSVEDFFVVPIDERHPPRQFFQTPSVYSFTLRVN